MAGTADFFYKYCLFKVLSLFAVFRCRLVCGAIYSASLVVVVVIVQRVCNTPIDTQQAYSTAPHTTRHRVPKTIVTTCI